MKNRIAVVLIIAIVLLSSCKKQDYESPAADVTSAAPEKEMVSEEQSSKGILTLSDHMSVVAEMGKEAKDRTVSVNQIVENALFTEGAFSKNRYLSYTISLRYISGDMAKSRSTVLKVMELYGFPVNSTLRAENNRLVQNAHMKLKTDSLYQALKLLNTAGILIEENIATEDFTNQSKRSEDKKVDSVPVTEPVKDLNKIGNQNIRDRVEWADVTIVIEGTEELILENRSLAGTFSKTVHTILYQLDDLLSFVLKNILALVILAGIVVLVVIRMRKKQ